MIHQFFIETHQFGQKIQLNQIAEDEAHGGHSHGPEWSRVTSVVVLVVFTAIFALIAENLVEEIQPTLEVTFNDFLSDITISYS